MMKYRLVCSEGHEFEGWFKSSDAYDDQEARGQIACPHCGTVAVSKAIMAPSVATHSRRPMGRGEANEAGAAKEVEVMLRELRAAVESCAEYVGPRFAEEARKIHYEECEERGVYGEASVEDIKALCEEGIAVLPLPRTREDLN